MVLDAARGPQSQTDQPAFASISIAPRIDQLLGPASLSAHYSSPRGPISIAWHRNASAMAIELPVDIPLGVSHALVSVPTPFDGRHEVLEGGLIIILWNESGSQLRDYVSSGMQIAWVATDRDVATLNSCGQRTVPF